MTKNTAMIVARDAEQTLADAMVSALDEPIDELLVVDDVSGDRTVEVARSFDDPRVRLVQVDEHRTLGHARQVGLQALEDGFCFLLDADDRFLPGRVSRLSKALQELELDFVADEIALVDGVTGELLRDMRIPLFLEKAPGMARIFERNFLPGVGQIAFRVSFMKRLGYDPQLHGVEDSDLVMRALLEGAKSGFAREMGYQMRHFPESVSRNRERQASELSRAMRKYEPERVRALLARNGMAARARDWAMVSFFAFRRQWNLAMEGLMQLESGLEGSAEILEPDGPFPYSERWRLDFGLGTLQLVGGEDGRNRLESACALNTLPEALNNLGVAVFKDGNRVKAEELWREALSLLPSYADARDNLRAERPEGLRITVHPLRREASRSDY